MTPKSRTYSGFLAVSCYVILVVHRACFYPALFAFSVFPVIKVYKGEVLSGFRFYDQKIPLLKSTVTPYSHFESIGALVYYQWW